MAPDGFRHQKNGQKRLSKAVNQYLTLKYFYNVSILFGLDNAGSTFYTT
jgi:hypothetical protein